MSMGLCIEISRYWKHFTQASPGRGEGNVLGGHCWLLDVRTVTHYLCVSFSLSISLSVCVCVCISVCCCPAGEHHLCDEGGGQRVQDCRFRTGALHQQIHGYTVRHRGLLRYVGDMPLLHFVLWMTAFLLMRLCLMSYPLFLIFVLFGISLLAFCLCFSVCLCVCAAPEVVNETVYDKSIDLWSIGVLTYILYAPLRSCPFACLQEGVFHR